MIENFSRKFVRFLLLFGTLGQRLTKPQNQASAQDKNSYTIISLIDKENEKYVSAIEASLKEVEDTHKIVLNHHVILFEENKEYVVLSEFCKHMSRGISLMLDLTWKGWAIGGDLSVRYMYPYVRIDVSNKQFLLVAEAFLQEIYASNALIFLPNAFEAKQAMWAMQGRKSVRFVILNANNPDLNNDVIKDIGIIPLQLVFIGSHDEITEMTEKLKEFPGLEDLGPKLKVIVVLKEGQLTTGTFNSKTYITIKPTEKTYCTSQGKAAPCQTTENIQESFSALMYSVIGEALGDAFRNSIPMQNVSLNCDELGSHSLRHSMHYYDNYFLKSLNGMKGKKLFRLHNITMEWEGEFDIFTTFERERYAKFATYSAATGMKHTYKENSPVLKSMRFLRIGTILDEPYAFLRGINQTELILKMNANRTFIDSYKSKLEGFFIEIIQGLAEEMNFVYDLEIHDKFNHGERNESGYWTGLTGDLIYRKTDIIVAPYAVTADREEILDYVVPYLIKSGVMLTMRKDEKPNSLFKFLTVLKVEVWYCLFAAVIISGGLIWIVDRISPFSGKNKKLYPYKCREFSFPESVWFVCNSLTPQGGGDSPKAISGRVMVAGYWVFVILMSATFTANLAAFLTIERSKLVIGSLDELSRMAEVDYSMIEDDVAHRLFESIANAEDKIFRVWKDMTLNASGDELKKYIVWDYPAREFFGRILQSVEKRSFLTNESEGFWNAGQNTSWGFVHDTLKIKYELTRNCNLTAVGESFGEHAYAIAVQTDSHLGDKISRALLNLEKDMFIETAFLHYWNETWRNTYCTNLIDYDGMTLNNVGGIFIVCGGALFVSFVLLIVEIVRHYSAAKTLSIKISHKKTHGHRIF